MICSTCRRTLLTRLRSQLLTSQSTHRYASSTSQSPPPPSPSVQLSSSSPVVSSATPSVAQPFSSASLDGNTHPNIPEPSRDIPIPKAVKLRGSIPGGQALVGIGYTKAKPTILAMEDDMYPEWLWDLDCSGNGAQNKMDGGVDLGGE